MIENIEKMLERGEHINVSVERTDHLNQSALVFKKRATQIQRKGFWNNVRMTLLITISLLGILYGISCIACGFPFFDRCLKMIQEI